MYERTFQILRRCFKTLTCYLDEIEFLDSIRTDQTRGQLVEGLEVFTEALIADLQPTEVAHPTERPLDDVAGLAQPAAVLRARLAVRRQERANAPSHHRRDDRL